jgi:thioredoxin 2
MGAKLGLDGRNLIVQCRHCHTKNRIPLARIAEAPSCGKCHRTLGEGHIHYRPVVVTDSTFKKEILDYPGPLLLDCWAPWCGPCKMMAPIMDQLAAQYAGRVKIAKLNVDQNPITSSKYNIMSIPTLMLFNGGQIINTIPGAVPKGEIEKHLQYLAGANLS